VALCTVGSSAGKLALQYPQPPHFANIEMLPPMRRSASTLTTDLKAEQRFHAVEKSTRAVITAAMSNEFPIVFGICGRGERI
jgi:hypothetical protein